MSAWSPFAAMRATSSLPDALQAAAGPSAPPGVSDVLVQQLARRATHASDVYADGGGVIAGQGLGTFTFVITVAGIDYPITVDVASGDSDAQVLDQVAAAVTAAAGDAGGYVAEDLGNHELDARLTVNGLASIREGLASGRRRPRCRRPAGPPGRRAGRDRRPGRPPGQQRRRWLGWLGWLCSWRGRGRPGAVAARGCHCSNARPSGHA